MSDQACAAIRTCAANLLLVLVTGFQTSAAQIGPDTTEAAAPPPPDTTLTHDIDEVEQAAHPPVMFLSEVKGRRIDLPPLVLTRYYDVTEAMADATGTFRFHPGMPDWPSHWAPRGLRAADGVLVLDGLPYNDIITGRPNYDLVPLELLGEVRIDNLFLGHGPALLVQTRDYEQPAPLTEIRFRSGAPGLQGVSVVHAQTRRRDFFGKPGLIYFMFNYAGRGVRGEYPNSNSSLRRVMGRVRYQQVNWSLELSNQRARINRGAHSGVLPRAGEPYETIYERFGAEVADSRASVRTTRNDFTTSFRLRWSSLIPDPLTMRGFWISQNLTYRNPPMAQETWYAVVNRYGVDMRQKIPVPLLNLNPEIRLLAWTDHVKETNAMSGAADSRSRLRTLSVQESMRLGPMELSGRTEVVQYGGSDFTPGAGVLLRGLSDRLRPEVELSHGTPLLAPVERYGFGPFMQATPDLSPGPLTVFRGGLAWSVSTLTFEASGFTHRQTEPLVLAENVEAENIVLRPGSGVRQGFGADFGIRWRSDAERGFRAVLAGQVLHPTGDESIDLSRPSVNPMPPWYADFRIGLRAVAFRGDLDFDVFIRAHTWGQMAGLTFHAPTGLYAVPGSRRTFGPSGTVDIYGEAEIRSATVFLRFENVLSGSLYPGTLTVPDYPLPAQAFGFGVYWPIVN